jgi:RES domain-containing protein
MIVYRIVQTISRTKDLSGTGSHTYGGRWNSKGTYMLYTSETSSLAYLESLVHFDPGNVPVNLFLMKIEVNDAAPIYTAVNKDYLKDWKAPGLIGNQLAGDKWMNEVKFLGIKIKSVVNELEHNLLLNPLFPDYHNLVKIVDVITIDVDGRFI